MPKKKQIIQALRGKQRLAPVRLPRIPPNLFTRLIVALQDARPIRSSEHYAYKDAQHKECVHRIGHALAAYNRSKTITSEEYAANFMQLVREE